MKDSVQSCASAFGSNKDKAHGDQALLSPARIDGDSDLIAQSCLSAILAGSLDAIMVIDQRRTICRWSSAAEDVFGYKSEDILGTDWTRLSPPSYTDELVALFDRVMDGESQSQLEIERLHSDGSPFRVIIWLSAVRSESGEVVGVVEVSRDVTERDNTNIAIRNSIRRESAIVDTAVDGIVTMDKKHLILSFNPAAESIFGFTADEVIGKNVSLLMPEPIKQEHDRYVRQYVDTGVRKVIGIGRETYGQRKDGTVFPMYLAVGDVDGTHDIFVGIIRDITEQKRSEQLLVEQQALLMRQTQELQRSNKELEHFAYVASHDLQEPLRMISSYLELLEGDYRDIFDENAHEYIGFVVGGAERLKHLINDLLEYSRIGNGELTLAEFHCESALRKATDALEVPLKSSGAVLTHDELPTVTGYESLFVSLFQNLIGNAIKFRSEETPQIHISAQRTPDGWQLSIADNGIGIDQKHAERIFVIFQRLHTRDSFPGTGIGLSICKKIADRHGGSIWVEPNTPKGSIFHVTLSESFVRAYATHS